MTQLTITTDAEAIAWLARMPCQGMCAQQCPMSRPAGLCTDCLGADGKPTGRRFPGLMTRCRHGMVWDAKDCGTCHGSNIRPIPIPDAMLYLMGQPEFYGMDHNRYVPPVGGGRPLVLSFDARWRIGDAVYMGPADTPIPALALAIAAAEGENA